MNRNVVSRKKKKRLRADFQIALVVIMFKSLCIFTKLNPRENFVTKDIKTTKSTIKLASCLVIPTEI